MINSSSHLQELTRKLGNYIKETRIPNHLPSSDYHKCYLIENLPNMLQLNIYLLFNTKSLVSQPNFLLSLKTGNIFNFPSLNKLIYDNYVVKKEILPSWTYKSVLVNFVEEFLGSLINPYKEAFADFNNNIQNNSNSINNNIGNISNMNKVNDNFIKVNNSNGMNSNIINNVNNNSNNRFSYDYSQIRNNSNQHNLNDNHSQQSQYSQPNFSNMFISQNKTNNNLNNSYNKNSIISSNNNINTSINANHLNSEKLLDHNNINLNISQNQGNEQRKGSHSFNSPIKNNSENHQSILNNQNQIKELSDNNILINEESYRNRINKDLDNRSIEDLLLIHNNIDNYIDSMFSDIDENNLKTINEILAKKGKSKDLII